MGTILIIEDNKEVRENTAELLELEGYKVHTAANGREGFQQTMDLLPDLVICDVMMPELDGMGFLKLVKSNSTTAGIPLIFFSAGSSPLENKLDQQNYKFLRKPFTDKNLYSMIARCLL